jgi:hypothetical protein
MLFIFIERANTYNASYNAHYIRINWLRTIHEKAKKQRRMRYKERQMRRGITTHNTHIQKKNKTDETEETDKTDETR